MQGTTALLMVVVCCCCFSSLTWMVYFKMENCRYFLFACFLFFFFTTMAYCNWSQLCCANFTAHGGCFWVVSALATCLLVLVCYLGCPFLPEPSNTHQQLLCMCPSWTVFLLLCAEVVRSLDLLLPCFQQSTEPTTSLLGHTCA